VIQILLQHYPEAARIPQGRTGRLPLVLAIESGRRTWEDGIRTLMNAFPPALHNKKLIEPKLYPNVLALVASGKGDFGRHADFHCLTPPGVFDDFLAPRFSRSKRLRQEAFARTTLFQLLRTKPEWLTKGVKE
jgi:hypothetical protein